MGKGRVLARPGWVGAKGLPTGVTRIDCKEISARVAFGTTGRPNIIMLYGKCEKGGLATFSRANEFDWSAAKKLPVPFFKRELFNLSWEASTSDMRNNTDVTVPTAISIAKSVATKDGVSQILEDPCHRAGFYSNGGRAHHGVPFKTTIGRLVTTEAETDYSNVQGQRWQL